MSKVYRVYSDFCNDNDHRLIINTWYREGINNIAVKNEDLSRLLDNKPFIKDLLDIAASKCEDNDIIIYTNSDIGLVSDPIENIGFCDLFFSARKNVSIFNLYTKDILRTALYEPSVNCDTFGFTKSWYLNNRHKLPDFVIGSPKWDIAFLLLLDGAKRLDNITFHIQHAPNWRIYNVTESNLHNAFLYNKFILQHNPALIEENLTTNKEEFLKYMSKERGYTYITNPVFITFFTPSHERLYNDIFLPSLINAFGDRHLLIPYRLDEQYCDSGVYHTNGWRQTQVEKIYCVMNAIKNLLDDQVFIFCDADILHVQDYTETLIKELEVNNFVAQDSFSKQKSYGSYCSGFYAAKKSEQIIKFLKIIHNDLVNNVQDEKRGDQFYLNVNSVMIKNRKTLDRTFYNPGADTNGELLDVEHFDEIISKLLPDTNIVHANYMLSPETKYDFLMRVKNHLLK